MLHMVLSIRGYGVDAPNSITAVKASVSFERGEPS
jgi:hypothetical protein